MVKAGKQGPASDGVQQQQQQPKVAPVYKWDTVHRLLLWALHGPPKPVLIAKDRKAGVKAWGQDGGWEVHHECTRKGCLNINHLQWCTKSEHQQHHLHHKGRGRFVSAANTTVEVSSYNINIIYIVCSTHTVHTLTPAVHTHYTHSPLQYTHSTHSISHTAPHHSTGSATGGSSTRACCGSPCCGCSPACCEKEQ